MFDKEKNVFQLKSTTSKKKINYEKELDTDQVKPVQHGEGPILVIAGAGSGKTRVLTYRVAYLINEKRVLPKNILLLTFTNKAGREMIKRVEQLLGEEQEGLTGGTYHHVGNRMLRKYAKLVGLQNNYTILDAEDIKILMKQAKAESGVDIKDKRLPKEKVLIEILSLSINKQLSIKDVVYEQFPYFISALDEIHLILDSYTKLKRDNNVVDFDDILVFWEKLLRENKDIREYYANQVYHYVLVDEFQDSNALQNNIVKLLSGDKQNVMVVGDPNQSIYAWRGAEIDNMLNFPKEYHNVSTYNVMYNYRSTPEILSLANDSIQHNEKRAEADLKPVKRSADKPFVMVCDDTEQESLFVAERILSLLDEGVELDDIAVLYRSHFMVKDIEMQLTAKNIPYEIQSGLRFFEQRHIKDIIAFVKLLHNPLDELSWGRTLQQLEGIGSKTVQTIMKNILSQNDVFEYLEAEKDFSFVKRGKKNFMYMVDIINKVKQLESADTIIEEFVESHYDEYMQYTFENYKDRKADVQSLLEFAYKYSSLETFLEELALLDGIAGDNKEHEEDKNDGAVQLTTIHKAKGLEWKYVFVINCTEGRFPNSNTMEELDKLEEERRLFYVATTRAEKELYLTYPSRMLSFEYKMWIMAQISPFISELNEDKYNRFVVQ